MGAVLANPIDMETFENAVHAWFKEAIDAEVIWAQQSAPRPAYPYGVLNIISGPVAVSPSWERRLSTDLGRAKGKEILSQTCVPCTFVVSCVAHVNLDDSRDPAAYARTLVTRAQSRLALLKVQAAFKVANISVQTPGPVTNISAVVSDANVSRAGIDVTFNASLSLDEYMGYIKTVAVKSVAPSNLGIDMTVGDI